MRDEQHFPRNGNVRSDSDDVFVRKHVGLLLVNYRSRELCVVIRASKAKILFDIPNTVPLCGGNERELSLSGELHQILCEITATKSRQRTV